MPRRCTQTDGEENKNTHEYGEGLEELIERKGLRHSRVLSRRSFRRFTHRIRGKPQGKACMYL